MLGHPNFMVLVLAVCGPCAIVLVCWWLARRGREPAWRDDELPTTIARKCRKLFRSYGIEASVSGDVTSFDMMIPGGQFPQKPGAIVMFCRSKNFLVGETLFVRIQEKSLALSGWTVMLIVTTPITNELTYLGKAHNIAVLDMREIHCFASALEELKAGQIRAYPGRSLLIRQFLKNKFYRAAA